MVFVGVLVITVVAVFVVVLVGVLVAVGEADEVPVFVGEDVAV